MRRLMKLALSASALLITVNVSSAQFTNGGFERGDFEGWVAETLLLDTLEHLDHAENRTQ